MIPLYYNLGKQLEGISVGIVENASPETIGVNFIDISTHLESLSRVPVGLQSQEKMGLMNEYTQTLLKAAGLVKDAGLVLGAKLGGDEDTRNKGNKTWMKKGTVI
jgi:hypothetical protein